MVHACQAGAPTAMPNANTPSASAQRPRVLRTGNLSERCAYWSACQARRLSNGSRSSACSFAKARKASVICCSVGCARLSGIGRPRARDEIVGQERVAPHALQDVFVGTPNAALGGGFGDAERIGNIGDGHVLERMQDERGSLVRAELFDDAAELEQGSLRFGIIGRRFAFGFARPADQ